MKITLEKHAYTNEEITPNMLTSEVQEQLSAVNEDNMYDLASDIVYQCVGDDSPDDYNLYEVVVQIEADDGNTYWEVIGI